MNAMLSSPQTLLTLSLRNNNFDMASNILKFCTSHSQFIESTANDYSPTEICKIAQELNNIVTMIMTESADITTDSIKSTIGL